MTTVNMELCGQRCMMYDALFFQQFLGHTPSHCVENHVVMSLDCIV